MLQNICLAALTRCYQQVLDNFWLPDHEVLVFPQVMPLRVEKNFNASFDSNFKHKIYDNKNKLQIHIILSVFFISEKQRLMV